MPVESFPLACKEELNRMARKKQCGKPSFVYGFLNALFGWHRVQNKNKMEEEERVHDIFLTNPSDLLKFVGRFVKISMTNGQVLEGTVYTVDPVSQSMVLIHKDIAEELSLKIILKHSISSVEIQEEVPEGQENVPGDIFDSKQFSSSKTNSKEDVKGWLEKNMIPVVENGDKLIIDSLEIHPPYGVDQCYSSNSIVLSRIQKLLAQIPCGNS